MTHEAGREPARDPQDLERLLVSEAHAVGDCGNGQLLSMAGKPSKRSTLATPSCWASGRSYVLELGENAPEGKMN